MLIKEKMKTIKNNVLAVLVILSVIPLLITTLLGLPNIDDFATWSPLAVSNKPVWTYFTSVGDEYMSWQGTYTSAFLRQIPIYKMFGLTGIRVEYFLITIVFLGVFGYLLWILDSQSHADVRQSMVVLLCSSLFLFNSSYLHEVFYWHTGIVGYTVPLIFGLVSIILLLTARNTKTRIIGCVFAFLGSGGALIVTAFICAIMLLFILIDRLEDVNFLRWEKEYVIFTIAVAGGIVNTAAPGNFQRASNFSENISMASALMSSVSRIHVEIKTSIMEVIILVIAFTVFTFAYSNAEKIEQRCQHPLIVMIAGYVSLVIVDFPVMLGYGIGVDTELGMPGRCYFIEKLAFLIVTIVVFWYIGVWTRKNTGLQMGKEWFVLCGIIITVALYLVVSPGEVVQLRMAKNLVSSRTHQWIEVQENILKESATNTASRLVFEVDDELVPEDIYVPTLSLSDRGGNIGNVYYSNYFGKEEVVLNKE